MYISEEACVAANREPPPAVNYANFPEKITAKYGVRCIRWPLRKFEAPGRINSLVSLHELMPEELRDKETRR